MRYLTLYRTVSTYQILLSTKESHVRHRTTFIPAKGIKGNPMGHVSLEEGSARSGSNVFVSSPLAFNYSEQ